MEIAPGGKIFAFTISSTIRCVSQAVGEAGFTTTGTPESNAGAAFSHSPQAGKLNALRKTAAPFSGIRKQSPTNACVLDRGSRVVSFMLLRSAILRAVLA